jgi:hypothetical protein
MLKRILRFVSFGLIIILFGGGWLAWQNTCDRHPGYSIDIDIAAPSPPNVLTAGFAAVSITPDVPDRWTDANANGLRDVGEGYEDVNGNGQFDAVWLAGFHNGRPASGVHDDLWARAMVLGDGTTRVALVVIDSIGLMNDQVIEIRMRLPARIDVDYVIISSTHTHSAPDVQGLWGARPLASGIDPAYRERLISGAAEAVMNAVASERPARLRLAEVAGPATDYVTDTRKPFVLDPDLRILHAVDTDSDETLGTLVAWANHPETAWLENVEVSSDFPHYVRRGIEGGVFEGERLVMEGLGGTAVYVNGAIGGLMTTPPEFPVRDPVNGQEFVEPSFEKVRGQGNAIALLALAALRADGVTSLSEGGISLRAKSFEIALDNRLLMLGAAIGLVPRGLASFGNVRTEIAAFRIGPATFLTVPGEIYPELVNGGIEVPPGADYPNAAKEEPPLREQMPGEFKFIFGLANDAIGYIIPKVEWDAAAPWIYGAEEETYGEVVSLGPEAGPTIHREASAVLAELQ